ncbi:prephenate dehydrogenase [Companilactobacillus insicii]|uniref:prephenate dehydrogenase n=1 Tax=Companilactobacillus insicii TaxID=1732567 RepID=UPI000F7977A1|nr:prephenate dehydrogenase [Companilactobacillus insicii]
MTTIIVDGLGAMGASIAEKLNDSSTKVYGIDNNKHTCQIAVENGVVDEITNPYSPEIKLADLIILAGPIKIIKSHIELLKRMDLSSETIVMDIGSTKSEIMGVAGTWKNFIGGHPMIGTDNSGIDNRNKNMFINKPFFLIGDESKIGRVTQLLEPLSCGVQTITASDHDKLVTSISDLPHVMSFALVNTIDGALPENQLNWQKNVAGGFIDTTRIAQSNPELWSQILMSNSESIVDGIDQIIITLQQYRKDLVEKNLSELSEKIKKSQIIRQKVGELHD